MHSLSLFPLLPCPYTCSQMWELYASVCLFFFFLYYICLYCMFYVVCIQCIITVN